jgi:hypothetical protein
MKAEEAVIGALVGGAVLWALFGRKTASAVLEPGLLITPG